MHLRPAKVFQRYVDHRVQLLPARSRSSFYRDAAGERQDQTGHRLRAAVIRQLAFGKVRGETVFQSETQRFSVSGEPLLQCVIGVDGRRTVHDKTPCRVPGIGHYIRIVA